MWQDYAFTIGGLVFVAGLIPTLLNPRSEVPRWRTAVPTAITLAVFSFVYTTLGMYFAATIQAVVSLSWFGIAVLRPIRLGIEVATPQFEVTMEEAQLILEWREWIIEQKRIQAEGAPSDGCDGCPSQAPDGGPGCGSP